MKGGITIVEGTSGVFVEERGEVLGMFGNRAGAEQFIGWYRNYWVPMPDDHAGRLEKQKQDSLARDRESRRR